ncbi:MAG TPA: GtrA family protein [Acidimicrobiales bacterium]|nr:GtrA family protein [Actinomycetes bacterium]HVN49928.1 GtrA family protein [Acidimicrobiales bacterium]
MTALTQAVRRLSPELVRFLTVGGLAYLVDVGLFNLLRYGGGDGVLHEKPLTAKAISTVVATVVAYVGNRFWTYGARPKGSPAREYAIFFVLNAIGLAITLSVLALTHYGLGLTSPLADNISANVIGLGLATAFRFWSYRRYVFVPGQADTDDPLAETLRDPV